MRHIGSKKIQMSLIKEDVIEDNVTVRENIKEEYSTQNDEPEDMNVVKVNDTYHRRVCYSTRYFERDH